MRTYYTPSAGKLLAILFVASLAASVTTGIAQDDMSVVTEGQKLYQDFGCFQCHGYEGQGSQSTPPVPRIAPTEYPLEAFSVFIRTPPRLMPAYSPNVLSDSQLEAIYDYVRSIPEPPAVADIPALQDLL